MFKTIKIIFLLIFTIVLGRDCFNVENVISINFVTFAVSLGLSVFEFIFDIIAANRLNILTQAGLDEKEKWKGLKNYMKDFSLLKEREIPSIVIWERYLVFATAFGIAKEVIKQMKIVYPELENAIDSQNLATTNLLLSSNFNDTFTKSVNSSINSIMSSGTGSGGGFSSGGGGGRRWWRHGRSLMHFGDVPKKCILKIIKLIKNI